MTQQPALYPGIFSRERLTVLFASLLVALSAGTNYGYSAYSPQLRERLRITHTQVNIVGLAGNYGVYGSAPLWGRIIDKKGPKLPMLCGFALLLTGYSGIRYIFVDGVPTSATTISTFTFIILVLCGLMTGAGGNAGLTGAVNSSAKTFPDNLRATATGVVVSGFGLSAFFFSNIARLAFPGNTASFLSLLAFGTSIPMLVGFFLVRPIPLPPQPHTPDEEARRFSSELAGQDGEDSALLNQQDEVEMSDAEIAARTPPQRLSRKAALKKGLMPNVYGSHLFKNTDFWTLFSILSLLAGTGLMYMNNVGDMAQALYAKEAKVYDPIKAAHWQADQVSAISLMNCLGRILIGLISDYSKHRFGFPRSFGCILVSFLYLSSQIAAIRTDQISNLWFASSILGLAHGAVFSLFPMVTLDWFGMPHFSENWGFISASPVVASNLYSIYFGRNLDAHSGKPSGGTPNPADESLRCLLGRLCYVDALYVTAGGCSLALGLSIWASIRDKRKIDEGLEALRERNRGEVVWEGGETM